MNLALSIDADAAEKSGSGKPAFSDFPEENPSQMKLKEWIESYGADLVSVGFGAIMRNELPARGGQVHRQAKSFYCKSMSIYMSIYMCWSGIEVGRADDARSGGSSRVWRCVATRSRPRSKSRAGVFHVPLDTRSLAVTRVVSSLRFPTGSSPAKVPADQSVPSRSQPLLWLPFTPGQVMNRMS